MPLPVVRFANFRLYETPNLGVNYKWDELINAVFSTEISIKLGIGNAYNKNINKINYPS